MVKDTFDSDTESESFALFHFFNHYYLVLLHLGKSNLKRQAKGAGKMITHERMYGKPLQ